MDDYGRFRVAGDAKQNLSLACNTPKRRDAWKLLPDPPVAFSYTEGELTVKPSLSQGAYVTWMRECRRLGIVTDTADGRLTKAVATPVGW
jgi:hypothetical protein